jgi:hypothetical protein
MSMRESLHMAATEITDETAFWFFWTLADFAQGMWLYSSDATLMYQ